MPDPIISIAPASVGENQYYEFQISLSQEPLDAVTVNYEVMSGTGERDIDVRASSSPLQGTVTFAPGEGLTKTITLYAAWENQDELDESFFIRLTDPKGATFGNNIHSLSTVGWVLDDDGAGLNRAMAVSAPVVTEDSGGKAVFTVSLSQPFDTDTSFSFRTHDGTAKAGTDYVAKTGTVTFFAGQTEATVEIGLMNNNLAEGTEAFSLSVSGAHNVTGTTATAQIIDDDNSLPVVSIDGVRATENNYFNFTVRLSEPAADAVTVDYNTFPGTATRDADVRASANSLSGTVTFEPGQTTQTIWLYANWENTDELDESFFVQLSNPVRATFGGNVHSPSAVGWLLDNDGPGLNRAIEVSDIVVNETSGGKAIFTVSLSEAFDDTRSFSYKTFDSSATSSGDYVAKTGNVTFLAGQTEAYVEIDLRNDGTAEAAESFGLALAAAHGVKGATGTALLMDDDSSQPIISIEGMAVPENEYSIFTLRLSKPATDAVTVDYTTLAGSAVLSQDISASASPLTGTVTFAPGQTTQQIVLYANWENSDELDENFTVQLYNPIGAGFGGANRSLFANGWVLDDDGPGLNRTVAVSGSEVREGAGGRVAVFAVELSTPADTAVTLRYQTVDGTARAGSDYTARSGNVTFAPGQTRAEIAVPIGNDLGVEGNEQFSLRVIPPFPGELSASATSAIATATIVDGTIFGTAAGNRLVGTAIADRIEGLGGNDVIFGRTGNDILVGGDGNDRLHGEGGRDRLLGGRGNDRYFVDRSDVISEAGGNGIDTVEASHSLRLAGGLENLVLRGNAHLNGTGNNLANAIVGNGGRNVLNGGNGHDRLSGNGGNDRLIGGNGNDNLLGGVGNDRLEGGAGNDRLTGGAGRDAMLGGRGNDRYIVDRSDVLSESGGNGIDTVEASHSLRLAAGFENLVLRGNAHLNGTGNNLGNAISGNRGQNVLNGGNGNDRLSGDAGNDRLLGGIGNDQMFGGAGNDRLIGGGGNDRLVGGAGRDVLDGGVGNDRYIVDASDVLVEATRGGVDTVEARQSMRLGANLDNLELVGRANVNGTGNNLGNVISGNVGRNLLNGGDGNDRLSGNAGNDRLLGGNGNDRLIGGAGQDMLRGDRGTDMLYGGADGLQRDVFVFRSDLDSETGAGRDRIYNFRSRVDDLDLRGIDANEDRSGNQAFDFSGLAAAEYSVWFARSGRNLIVRADNDGDARADFEVMVAGLGRLVEGDFLL